MRHGETSEGHMSENRQIQTRTKDAQLEDFVLEKSIFNNVFEKDIRRVFIYKKAERLAKALHLISPAFSDSASLRSRVDAIAIGLVDAATHPPSASLSRELLALSSILSIARAGGLLSVMNTELITREAHILLQEVASYEEPRLFLDDAPTLSEIAKNARAREGEQQIQLVSTKQVIRHTSARGGSASGGKGHVKDTEQVKDRRETILSVIKNKHKASIKDISTHVRGVSEKTIQRELSALIEAGSVIKEGERRWSVYSLA